MASRLLTFAVWVVVLVTALFWGFKVFVQKPSMPAQVQMPSRGLAMGGELKRLLGVSVVAQAEEPDEPDTSSDRYQLLGVVAPRGAKLSAQGVALIAVNGEPAKAWRTGATIDGDVVLLAVDKRSVKLGPRGGPATTELTLPEPEAATSGPATGMRPTLGGQPVPQPGVVPMRPGGVIQPGIQNGMAGHVGGAQPMPRPTPQSHPADDDTEEDDSE